MPTILVVTGSVRPNSVNEKIVPLIVEEIKVQGSAPVVADLKELNLPFFDDPHSPLSEEFAPEHESVKTWTNLVANADGVVLVTPEYNHTLTPIQINAVDWIGKEWANKPVALVGYGWGGANLAHATARQAMSAELKANILPTTTNFSFMKELNPDGSILDAETVASQLTATIEELVKASQ